MEEKIEQMKLKGYVFDKGLSDEEIKIIEEKYDIKFPKSLKEFYKIGLPISDGFVNWRDFSEENVKNIKERIERPFNELFWDMENNGFWIEGWDEPPTIEEKKKIFFEKMKNEPKPIPVFIHRYILSSEGVDNPVILSMKASDIIIYGDNLMDYIDVEFLNRENIFLHEYKPEMGKWIDIMES